MVTRNFLLVYNWQESKLDHWRDLDREIKDKSLTARQARKLYAEYEQRYPQSEGYEVVLIGADSFKTVQKTHAHYFGGEVLGSFEELLGA
jgi:hypothetical protein